MQPALGSDLTRLGKGTAAKDRLLADLERYAGLAGGWAATSLDG